MNTDSDDELDSVSIGAKGLGPARRLDGKPRNITESSRNRTQRDLAPDYDRKVEREHVHKWTRTKQDEQDFFSLQPIYLNELEDGSVEVSLASTEMVSVDKDNAGVNYPVYFNGVLMDGDIANKAVIPAGDMPATIYCSITTSGRGVLEPNGQGGVDLVTSEPAAKEHHVPEVDGVGTSGAYYWEVAKVSKVGESLEWTPLQGNLIWEDYTLTANNIGGQVEVLSDITSDGVIQFRTLIGDGEEPTSSETYPLYIKVDYAPEDEEGGDVIKIEGSVEIEHPAIPDPISPIPHAFYIEEVSPTEFWIHAGSFYYCAAADDLVIDTSITPHVLDSSRQLSDMQGGDSLFSHPSKALIPDMKADTYGLKFSTDHLGNVESAELDWEPSPLTEHNPHVGSDGKQAIAGSYFRPIVSFTSDNLGGFTKEIRWRSDISWYAHNAVAYGITTLP